MTFQVSERQVRWHRLRRTGLAGRPFGSPVAVARALFGIQAQINSAAKLALWHRLASDSGGTRRDKIESAVQAERSLVRLWGQRGTLHLFAADDWPLVCAAMSARVIAQIDKRARQRHGEASAEPDAGTRGLILDLLGRSPHGRVSKRDVSEKGRERDVEAFYRTAVALCMEGQVCRVETGDNASPETTPARS